MNVNDRIKALDFKGRDFPILRGDVKMTLKNVHNGKTEVYEKHNLVTNALSDIFGNNYGGLINYNNFADLYKTFLGGVLVFANALDDTDPTDYGIPAYTSNPVTAHAGMTPMTSQVDDSTRGDPDDTAIVTQESSVKMTWEWGTNAGNGPIASLGLTHSDVGSFGSGVVSVAQKSLVPFADVGCVSRSYTYGDNGNTVLGINGNTAYNFYLVDSTTVHIYKTPISNTKFKLQSGPLLPLADFATMITATLPSSYAISGKGGCYYHFDFDNNKLILFGVPTDGGTTLYRDDIDLDTGTVTHQTITVTGARLWKFRIHGTGLAPSSDYGSVHLPIPTKAMINGNNLFVYGWSTYANLPDLMYRINLTNTADISEVDTTDFGYFADSGSSTASTKTSARHTSMGGLIIQDNYIINGDKVFPTATLNTTGNTGGGDRNFVMPKRISSPSLGVGISINTVSVCKLYLATKFNLQSAVTKNASQAMTIEYTLTEV